jgi:hypothetical protein
MLFKIWLSRTRREKAQTQRENKALFYGLFSFVTFVAFVVKKIFPLKTVEPKIYGSSWQIPQVWGRFLCWLKRGYGCAGQR